MKCNTKNNETPVWSQIPGIQLVMDNWQEIRQALDIDLEVSARESQALLRRRGIKSGVDLLRLILFAVLSDWSLRLIGVWATLQGIGNLSDVAILKRLRGSSQWLGMLIGYLLAQRCRTSLDCAPIRIRLMDATTISRPGSQGTDWRIHLSLNINPLCVAGVQVTDVHGGETLARFPAQEGEIRVADRGYASCSGLGSVLGSGGALVVRINGQNLPLDTLEGQPLDLLGWLKHQTAPIERPVVLTSPAGVFVLRLCVSPLHQEAAERARQRVRRIASKKGRTPSQNSLLAAGFVLILTNLPAQTWSLAQVFALYRLRWQVEVQFKRYKSLLQLDHLRAKDPALAQTYLLGKLLAILILDGLIHHTQLQQPDWFCSLDRPVSLWCLTVCLWESLRQLICGQFSLVHFFNVLPKLKRYLCNAPRDRPQQLAWARSFLEHININFPSFSGSAPLYP